MRPSEPVKLPAGPSRAALSISVTQTPSRTTALRICKGNVVHGIGFIAELDGNLTSGTDPSQPVANQAEVLYRELDSLRGAGRQTDEHHGQSDPGTCVPLSAMSASCRGAAGLIRLGLTPGPSTHGPRGGRAVAPSPRGRRRGRRRGARRSTLYPAGPSARLARPAPGHVPPDPPVARGWPLARPGSGMCPAVPGRQAARAGLGVPIPGRAIGEIGRSRAEAGLNPGEPRFHFEHGLPPRARPCGTRNSKT